MSVIIQPAGRLNVHLKYQLVLNGTTSTALTSPSGSLLDGNDDGKPGGDFVTIVNRANLVLGTPGHALPAPARWIMGTSHPRGASVHTAIKPPTSKKPAPVVHSGAHGNPLTR